MISAVVPLLALASIAPLPGAAGFSPPLPRTAHWPIPCTRTPPLTSIAFPQDGPLPGLPRPPNPIPALRAAVSSHRRRMAASRGWPASVYNEAMAWRAAAAVSLSALYAARGRTDALIVRAWAWLQTGTSSLPRAFRHDHWEWGLATAAFFVFIHAYLLADRAVAAADRKGRVHPWKKYRLQDQNELVKRRRRTGHGGDGEVVVFDDAAFEGMPPVQQAKWHWKMWIFELPLYVLPLYIWDITIPRRAAKIASWSAPTTLKICSDVTCGLLLYDLGFFVCHYIFHRVPIFYRLFHKKHHTSTEVRAADQVRLSGVEEVVDVGISILALNYMGAHPMSRSLYNMVIVWMLCELHCGFVFPWSPQEVVPFGISNGSRGHHAHHRYNRYHYQKFFCTVDRLFGFVHRRRAKKESGNNNVKPA